MKKYLFFLSVALMAQAACGQQDTGGEGVSEIRGGGANADLVRNPVSANTPLDTSKLAKISFDSTTWHFGVIKEGEVIEHDFHFVNTGAVPLIISEAQGSCGCTVPKWPEEPIPPGGTGVIQVKFNSNDRVGDQAKSVQVIANTIPNKMHLRLKGKVVEK